MEMSEICKLLISASISVIYLFIISKILGKKQIAQLDFVDYVCFTQYDETMPNVEVAFKPEKIKNTFGEYISKMGYKQLRIAETEKYAHVTFFFNGGNEVKYEGEEFILVDTAGIRKKSKVNWGVEKFAVDRAIRAIRDCDIAVLVVGRFLGAG